MAEKEINCPWCKAKPGGCAKCNWTRKVIINTDYPKRRKS